MHELKRDLSRLAARNEFDAVSQMRREVWLSGLLETAADSAAHHEHVEMTTSKKVSPVIHREAI
jgi:hypothetical protein